MLTLHFIYSNNAKERFWNQFGYNDKIEIYFNAPLRNGPDDDRGCSFFVGVGCLPRATLHKDECEADIIKIEMLAG